MYDEIIKLGNGNHYESVAQNDFCVTIAIGQHKSFFNHNSQKENKNKK
jgi:hypothetical protein